MMFKRKKTPTEEQTVAAAASPAAPRDKGKPPEVLGRTGTAPGKTPHQQPPGSGPRPVTDLTSPGSGSAPGSDLANPQSTAHMQSGVVMNFDPDGAGRRGGEVTVEEEVFDNRADSDLLLRGRERIDTAASIKIDCSYEL